MKSPLNSFRSRPNSQQKTNKLFFDWFLCFCAIAALSLTYLVPRSEAGTISTDFDPSQMLPGTLYGAATNSPTAAPLGAGPCLELTSGTNYGQSGLFVLNEVDTNLEVESFVASFDLFMGSLVGLPLHGDGFSFSFVPADDVPTNTLSRAYIGTGSGLNIGLVVFDNTEVTNTGYTVQVSLGNQLVGLYSAPYLNTGTNFIPVTITAHTNGNVDLVYGTHTVFSNLFCFVPTQGQFCFAADSHVQDLIGDDEDAMWLQHLSVTTTVTTNTSLISALPLGKAVAPNAPVQIQIQNNSTSLDPATLALSVNGVAIPTASVSFSQSASIGTITYQPATNFPANASIPVLLTYQDNAHPANSYTDGYSFTTYPYATLPTSYAVGAASVSKTDGMAYYIYLYQAPSVLDPSIATAEQEVSGAISNAADLTLSGNADGGFNWPSANTIDFSTAGLPGEFLGANNGSGTTKFPNGDLGSYYAVEVLTFLQLNPGTYTFGVDTVSNNWPGLGGRTEAGFKVTAGASPRDFLAPAIASFDHSYPEGYSQFSFVVAKAGLYPFRLLAYSGQGDGSLEWYMVTTNGERVDLVTGLGAANVFGTPLITHPWVEYSPTPAPGATFVPTSSPISASIVDGTATTVAASIAMTLNGASVIPQSTNQFSVTNMNSTPAGQTVLTGTEVTYTPPYGLASGTTNVVTLAFTDTSGLRSTDTWSFTTVSTAKDPHLLVVEAEDYFTNFPCSPIVDNSTNVPPGCPTEVDVEFLWPDPNTHLMVHEWVFGSDTVTNYFTFTNGGNVTYYSDVVTNPTAYAVTIPGYSGTGYMVPLPNCYYNVNTNVYYTLTNAYLGLPSGTVIRADCGMAYNVYFQDPGIYYIWCRGWGDTGGDAENKSCNFGLDWVEQSTSFRMGGGPGFPLGAWHWDNINAQTGQPCYVTVTNSGWHVVNLWMREDGFVADKFLLTTNSALVPSGLGPAENVGTPPPPSIVLSIAPIAAGLKISWTGAGVLQASANAYGPFANLPGGTNSPVIITPSASRQFYRVAN